MAAKKKNFTTADGAIDKLFTTQKQDETTHAQDMQDTHVLNDMNKTQEPNVTQNTNDTDITQIMNNTHTTKPTNKSKHFEERGKRAERFGLLLDERLKEDLKHLSMAKGSKSINDFIITILLEYIGREENQTKLERYRKLLLE